MNCLELRADMGLYVEGDLSWRRIEQIEKHLTVCRACQALADDLQQTQTELRQLRNEVVGSETLHRIRAGVLAQVQAIESQRTWLDRAAMRFWGAFRLRYVITTCLVLGVAAGTVWQWERPAVSVRAPVPLAVAIAPIPRPVVEPSSTQLAANRAVAQQVAHKSARAKRLPKAALREDLVVQIQTDDPNIIIYWLVDQNTGGY